MLKLFSSSSFYSSGNQMTPPQLNADFLSLTTETSAAGLLKQHLNHLVLSLNVTVSLSADSHRDVSVS